MIAIVSIVILLLLAFKIYYKLTTGWCLSNTCLKGKTAVVTGSNCGIGYETALDFAKRGARVILACRSPEKAEEARKKIIEETGNENVIVQLLDYSSFSSVRKFCSEIISTEQRLDILINNAGVGGITTNDENGRNSTMKTNYYSHFLLTNLLLDLLSKTPDSRIVNVSSIAAKYNQIDTEKLKKLDNLVSNFDMYGRSKLCQIFFTRQLAKRLKGTSVTAYSLHPGLVATNIFRKKPKWTLAVITFIFNNLFKSSVEGAQTSIFLGVAKNIEHFSGEHFSDCKRIEPYRSAQDMYIAEKLWEKSEEIVNLTKEEKQY